jgi:amino acid permease
MDSDKREVVQRSASIYSQKEETKIETITDENDRITASSVESQENPQLKRTLKSRHLAVSKRVYNKPHSYTKYNH